MYIARAHSEAAEMAFIDVIPAASAYSRIKDRPLVPSIIASTASSSSSDTRATMIRLLFPTVRTTAQAGVKSSVSLSGTES